MLVFQTVGTRLWYDVIGNHHFSVGDWMLVLHSGAIMLMPKYSVSCLIVLVCCDDIDLFCPCLLVFLLVFGVLSIIGQHHYFVFIIGHCFAVIIGVKYLSNNFCALSGVLVNMTEPIWCYCNF